MSEHPTTRVAQKWGFGMAPPKPATQAARAGAAADALAYLEDPTSPAPTAEQLSELKGLFSRAHRQDQWDWFVCWQMLGRPGRETAMALADGLATLRRALAGPDAAAVEEAVDLLRRWGSRRYLHAFLGGPAPVGEGRGYIYVLSTREQPRLLKIGYTDRDVEQRVAEINRATGVVIPYGVRALWVVNAARDVEREVHARLAAHRVRPDREFFDMDFRDAFAVIRDYVREARAER